MEPEKKTNSALIGAIIIILILLIGGIYVWASRSKEVPAAEENIGEADAEELDSLERDLNNANTDIEANVINSVE